MRALLLPFVTFACVQQLCVTSKIVRFALFVHEHAVCLCVEACLRVCVCGHLKRRPAVTRDRTASEDVSAETLCCLLLATC